MHTVHHNGVTWVSPGFGKFGRPVWPIDELLVRKKFKPTVQERIRRLNPNGKEEGEICRGWWEKPASFRRAKRAFQRGTKMPWRFRNRGGRRVYYTLLHGPPPAEMF